MHCAAGGALVAVKRRAVNRSAQLRTSLYMHRPSNALFDHPNNIWWSIQIIKFLITEFAPTSCYFPFQIQIFSSARSS
jgi:hypothetical protein